jgi:acyl-CoA thioesterase I
MKKISKKIYFLGALVILMLGSGIYSWLQNETDASQPVDPVSTIASAEAIRIVAFGDSLTAGYGLSLNESYPALLEQELLKQGLKVEVINSGVSGETSAGGVRRAEFIRGLEPDIVLFGLGGNDALRLLSSEELEKNLTTSLEILLAGDNPPRVLLLGMRAPGNADAQYRASFDAVYPRLAEKYSLPLVPFFLEGVALDPAYSLVDGIHPNEAGYRIIVEKNILPFLNPLLLKE